MAELLRDVLIKETGAPDKVFIVDNLPKSLLYRTEAKLIIDYTNPQQNLVPEFSLDQYGKKTLTGTTTEVLKDGITISQTGDGAFVFDADYIESQERLKEIDRYINFNMPQAERIPQRVSYALQNIPSSPPKSLSQIPRVVLPELVSPPAKAVLTSQPARDFAEDSSEQVTAGSSTLTPAQARMAKARAARKTNQESK